MFKLLQDKDDLHQLLKRYLQQKHIPDFVAHTYSKIDKPRLFEIMGLKGEAELKKVLVAHELSGDKFVTISPLHEVDTFKLDSERVAGLA